MKLADPATTFEGNLPAGTRLTFQLKSNPKMFAILSDGIYSDKVSAVIRELCCNAHDSTVTAKHGRPFTVNVPTNLETNFWVEDTGLGIDPDKIVDIFWTYGASTKTDSNETIGALGLGSKSPFAYTKSSFLVVNRYNGVEYKYFCFINEVGIPDGKLVYEAATTEPNGVRVELAVRAGDVGAFRQRIVRLFSFWDDANMPTFHGDTSVVDSIKLIKSGRKLSGKNWELRGSYDDVGRGAYAVMGGVPYPINFRSLGSTSRALQMVCDSMINITFPMGSLDFQVSREELSYTDETIKVLEAAAQGIVQDILATAKAKLVGFTSPFELSTAYREIATGLKQSFAHASTLLVQETFALADGRKFQGNKLIANTFRVNSKSHLPFCLYRVERQAYAYSKGQQRYGIENKLIAEMDSADVTDPATNVVTQRGSSNIIPWFKVSTVAAPWINQNRKRTAANYLHAGFKVTGTRLEYSSDVLVGAFIINDLADRGAEGIRFYTDNFLSALGEAFRESQLYFVDGSTAAMQVDAIETELKAFLTGSLLEGTPIVRLSALPNFKLPEAPKADPKPRALIQRGTIEQRMITHSFDTLSATPVRQEARYIIEHAEDFALRFRAPDRAVTAYKRHDLSKPMLYVDTNWGTPVTAFDKRSIGRGVIGALYSLGLLDDFIQATPTGFEICIGMLSPNHIEELNRRKVTLVNFKDLLAKVKAFFDAQPELIAAFSSRADSEDDDVTVLSRLMSKQFMRHGFKHLSKTNKIAVLMTVHDRINEMLKGNEARCALIFLIYSGWYGSTDEMIERLNGRVRIGELLVTYPLLQRLASMCSHDTDPAIHHHVAAYINTIDQAKAQAEEAAKLDKLAALHAESIFEIN